LRRPAFARRSQQNPRCQVPPGSERLPQGRRIHEGMDRGAAAMKRSARTASINKTVTTMFPNRDLDEIVKTKPTTALTWNVHKKIRQEALDAEGSFRNDNLPIVPRVFQLASASSAASQAPGRLAIETPLAHDLCPAKFDCTRLVIRCMQLLPGPEVGPMLCSSPGPLRRIPSRAIACRATAWSYATCAVRADFLAARELAIQFAGKAARLNPGGA